MRLQRWIDLRHTVTISDSTLMRARTSSERLVSCVEVASISCGQWRARCCASAWNWRTLTPKVLRLSADLVQ